MTRKEMTSLIFVCKSNRRTRPGVTLLLFTTGSVTVKQIHADQNEAAPRLCWARQEQRSYQKAVLCSLEFFSSYLFFFLPSNPRVPPPLRHFSILFFVVVFFDCSLSNSSCPSLPLSISALLPLSAPISLPALYSSHRPLFLVSQLGHSSLPSPPLPSLQNARAVQLWSQTLYIIEREQITNSCRLTLGGV